jgi:hypothetical protein
LHVLGDVCVSLAAGFLLRGWWLQQFPRSDRVTHVGILLRGGGEEGIERGPCVLYGEVLPCSGALWRVTPPFAVFEMVAYMS